MATQKIETAEELEALLESGDIGEGALVREEAGDTWLVYDTEDGPWAVRPPTEEEWYARVQVGVLVSFEDFSLPLYVTNEERAEPSSPRVVCICGSTRFRAEITEANRVETMAGRIVVAPGVYGHDGDPMTDEDKTRLDELHRRKIDLADEVLVVNPDGYIGHSTRLEIGYAVLSGKPVRYTWVDLGDLHTAYEYADPEEAPGV
ncbi:hypothetical protein [Kocuria rosea]|uniref:hypothetical protein n=1 Tax=Kocuria rosea TaxID=1275 RepID=UPI003D326F31